MDKKNINHNYLHFSDNSIGKNKYLQYIMEKKKEKELEEKVWKIILQSTNIKDLNDESRDFLMRDSAAFDKFTELKKRVARHRKNSFQFKVTDEMYNQIDRMCDRIGCRIRSKCIRMLMARYSVKSDDEKWDINYELKQQSNNMVLHKRTINIKVCLELQQERFLYSVQKELALSVEKTFVLLIWYMLKNEGGNVQSCKKAL